MAGAGKPKRTYTSVLRQQQAQATRRAVLEASQRLFERDGYAATTIDAIAEEAGVATKTVYAAFSTKAGLLRAVWDLLLKGDMDDAPVAVRPWYVQVLEEPDPVRQLELTAHASRLVKERIGTLLGVIRSAAPLDPDSGALWQLIQSDFYENQRAIVSAIAEHGGLRPGLTPTQATDLLWTFNHPDVWLLLVGQRGWTPEAFERWFAATTIQQLLGRSEDAERRRPAPKRRRAGRPPR